MSTKATVTTETVEDTYAARVTAQAVELGLTATDAAERLARSEDAVNEVTKTYAETLALSVYVFDVCFTSPRGKQTEIAKGLAMRLGIKVEAAKKRVSRWVRIGEILAAHPTADPVAVATFSNRADIVGHTAAVNAKGDPIAAGERAMQAAKTAAKRAARPNMGEVTPDAPEVETDERETDETPTPRKRAEVIGDHMERAFEVLSGVLAEIEAHPDLTERAALAARFEAMTGLIRKNSVALVAKTAA